MLLSPYHATAVDTDEHLARCFTYIDLNMVRAGVVDLRTYAGQTTTSAQRRCAPRAPSEFVLKNHDAVHAAAREQLSVSRLPGSKSSGRGCAAVGDSRAVANRG
jgi:hypothetical protein